MSMDYYFDMHSALEAGATIVTKTEKYDTSYDGEEPVWEVFITHWFHYGIYAVQCDWYDPKESGKLPTINCHTGMGSKHRNYLPKWLDNNDISWDVI